jgi:chromosome segregation ATPase
MWNAFNQLAEKAKAAAADLEGQLNESVGIEAAAAPPPVADDDNVWKEDAFDDDMTDEAKDPVARSPAHTSPAVALQATEAAPSVTNDAWAADDDDLDLDETEEAADEPIVPVVAEVAAPEQVATRAPATEAPVAPPAAAAARPTPPPVAPPAPPPLTTPANDSMITASNVVKELPISDEDGWQEDLDLDESEPALDETLVETAARRVAPPVPAPKAAPEAPLEEEVVAEERVEKEATEEVAIDEAPVEEAPVEELLPVEEAPVEEASEDEAAEEFEQIEPEVEAKVDTFPEEEEEEIPFERVEKAIAHVPPRHVPQHAVDETPVEEEVSESSFIAQPEAEPEVVAVAPSPSPLTVGTEELPRQGLAQNDEALEEYQTLVEQLKIELGQREAQLVSKTEQMTSMQVMFESEQQELVKTVEHTKAEAKRRIQLAKERVAVAEGQAAQHNRGQSDDSQKQAQIIIELRAEGEKLAHKQADMERAVRTAKGEARKYRESLEDETGAKEQALEKITDLQTELKSTKDRLAAARRGESQASKLENELQSAKEEAERKASTILSLEQQMKELKAEAKDLMTHLEAAEKGAAIQSEREQKKVRKEQSHLVDDFEVKLRTSEKEAAVREDALRLEVSELRKRWQDAVRRADSLSMDVQSSTAPLMRQLESMERQNRARAAAWTELENKLRTELEETMISNEKFTKEKSEMKTKLSRLERTSKESQDEMRKLQNDLEEKTYKLKQLQDELANMEEEGAKMKKQWAEVERLANEGVARVRSEMSQTMLEADGRHRSQVDGLQAELRQERDKRGQLEEQVEGLVDKAGAIVPIGNMLPNQALIRSSLPPKKLRKSEGQAAILAGALNGLGDDDDDDDWDDHAEEEDDDDDDIEMNNGGTSSFAAFEQLTSRLKATKVELTTLRKSLADSEESRERVTEELSDARNAKEKLPLFEARVQELTVENEEMSREIAALQADVADVRDLYRTQLNELLEEKTAALVTNGEPQEDEPSDGDQGWDEV